MLSLRGSVFISACFHIVVYVVFFVLSSVGGARAIYKPQYEVRLVDPGELSGTRKTGEQKPVPKPEPVPPQPPKEKVAVPEKKPEVVTKPKEVVDKPKEVVEKPEPKEEVKEQAREKQAQEALDEVLARINKKVGKREQMLAKKGEGGGASGSGGWGERQKEMQYNAYLDQVYHIVRGNWNNPPDFDMNNKSVMTVVSITILADGTIKGADVEQSSGDPLFDQSVMRAILKSNPLPPPPIGIDQQSYDLGLRFFP